MDPSLAFLLTGGHSNEHRGLGLHNTGGLLGLFMERGPLAVTLNELNFVVVVVSVLGSFLSLLFLSAG